MTTRKQTFEIFQFERIGPIAHGVVGIFMHFHKKRVDAGGDSGPRQRRDILALPARSIAQSARQLQTVGGVEDHRIAELAHDHQRAHIGNQIIIAKGSAALGEQNLIVAGGEDFVEHVAHVPGREKLPFLYVDDFSRARHRQNKIGLAAEKRGICKTSATSFTAAT